MKTKLHLALVFVTFLSFPFFSCAQAPFAEESKAKTDLREAMFRYMFEHYNYGPDVKVFCIQAERPLPESFLLRFSQNRPRVVWDSDCELTGAMNSVKQEKTGARGLRMTVMSIKWISGQEAEARVSTYSDGIAANWNILRVVSMEGHWVVKTDRPDGVS
jgi:hypothetical protein